MAQVVVMYKTPRDSAAFDKHYAEKHIPLAKKIPGVKTYEISKGAVAMPGGAASPYHLVATLQFDDMAAVQKAFGSPEGQAAVADVGTFATGGVDIYMFDTRPA
jgi:uncharacterized protein (TIGR02118 family)